MIIAMRIIGTLNGTSPVRNCFVLWAWTYRRYVRALTKTLTLMMWTMRTSCLVCSSKTKANLLNVTCVLSLSTWTLYYLLANRVNLFVLQKVDWICDSPGTMWTPQFVPGVLAPKAQRIQPSTQPLTRWSSACSLTRTVTKKSPLLDCAILTTSMKARRLKQHWLTH